MQRKADGRQAEYCRTQAEDARARADQMRDPIAKATMLEIARQYEAMAERAAKREAGSG
jgi:hypothetical protein